MRAGLVLACLLACAGCPSPRAQPATLGAPPHTTAPSPSALKDGSRAPTIAERSALSMLMRETERLRELSFRAPVDVRIARPRDMRQYVLETLDRRVLERARARYLALGALDPTIDLEALLLGLMEEELIGYYDPKRKQLAIRDDVARALGTDLLPSAQALSWRGTVVHELVHALQDQHFDLSRVLAAERTTDADNAMSALIEGDATLTTLAYTEDIAGRSLDALVAQPDRITRLLASPADFSAGALSRAPALVREPLLFRYREGTLLCAAILQRNRWAGIDAAHHHAPDNTWSVLSPERYANGLRREALPAPSQAHLRALGFEIIDEDSLGALELGILLRARPLLGRAWRDDRYVVVTTVNGVGSLWWIALDSSDAARITTAAFEALGDPLRHVEQRGKRVVVGYGIPEHAFAQVVRTTHAGPRARRLAAQAKTAPTSEDSAFDPLATVASGH